MRKSIAGFEKKGYPTARSTRSAKARGSCSMVGSVVGSVSAPSQSAGGGAPWDGASIGTLKLTWASSTARPPCCAPRTWRDAKRLPSCSGVTTKSMAAQ